MNADFIGEDDLRTFEGWLRYQAVDPNGLTSDQLAMWRSYFSEVTQRNASGPKLGRINLRRIAGEQKYGVALRDGIDLWLTLWVRCVAEGRRVCSLSAR